MANLSELDKERCRFHLGVTDSVPDGDRIIFEDRLNHVTEKRIQYIKQTLDALDKSYDEILKLTSPVGQQLIAGDVNRSVTEFESAKKVTQRRYQHQRQMLCEALGVIDFRMGGNANQWRVVNSVVVPHLSDHDGTSIAARLYMQRNFS